MMKRRISPILIVWLVVALLWSLPLGGCCEEQDLELERFDGYINGVSDLTADFHGGWLTGGEVNFSLDFWSGFSWFSLFDFSFVLDWDFDFGFNPMFSVGEIYFDIDNDALKELIEVMRVVNRETGEQFVFFNWEGDEYTLDVDMNYVGWMHDGTTVIVAGDTSSGSGAMIVEAQATATADMTFWACADDNRCGHCDEDGTLDACMAAAASGNFSTVINGGASVDSSTQVDTSSSSVAQDTQTETDTGTGTDTETGAVAETDTATGTVTEPDTDSDSVTDSDTSADTMAGTTDTTSATGDTDTTDSATGSDTQVSGSTDTSIGFGLDVDSDDTDDVNIGFDGDTVTIDVGDIGGIGF